MSTYRLDTRCIREGFDRCAAHYDDNAVVHRLAREQLLERLDYVAIKPRVVLDAGCGTGAALGALRQRYPDARLIALDSSRALLEKSRARDAQSDRLYGDARALPLADDCVDLLFSNGVLPWCDNLDGALAEFRRVMTGSALLSFTTLGPDTLMELRAAWRAVDGGEHVHAFIDMHDIGDALLRAGFSDPVLDVDRYVLTYRSLRDLLQELRRTGSRNALPGRARGLTSGARFEAVENAYERSRSDGRLPATVEIVYGHAWRPAGPLRATRADGTAVFPADAIRRRRGA